MKNLLKPMISVLCTENGDYYVYQARDLQSVDGLQRNLNKKSPKDRFFVTQVI